MLGPCARVGTHTPLAQVTAQGVQSWWGHPQQPQNWLLPEDQGSPEELREPEASALPCFRAWGAQQHPGSCPPPPPRASLRGKLSGLPLSPCVGTTGLGEGEAGSNRGGRGVGPLPGL